MNVHGILYLALINVVNFVGYRVGICDNKVNTSCFTICQLNCGKIMFLIVSVHHSVHEEPHVTITNDALDLTIQGPPGHGASLYRDPRPPGSRSLSGHLVAKTGDLFKFVH